MISIDPAENSAFEAISRAFPEWSNFIECSAREFPADYPYKPFAGKRVQYHVFSIPSANPRVTEPLRLETLPEVSLFWYRGYFYDFPTMFESRAEWHTRVVAFLHDFVGERIVCAVTLSDGRVVSGGPEAHDWNPASLGSESYYPDYRNTVTEIRSWRGSFDVDWSCRDDKWEERRWG